MKRLLLPFLCLLGLFVSARAQTSSQLNAGSKLTYTGTTGAYTFSWWGVSGNTYLIQTSDDLVNWSYLPLVESGSSAAIQWGLTSTSSNLFVKLEYITSPIASFTGTLHGPDNNGDGLPDDWELLYYGTTSVSGTSYVSWSNGTITNLQAYQKGLNPLDFFHGTLPNMTAVTGTSLPYESGSSVSITVQITNSLNQPIPGGLVIFSIDYGLLEAPGNTSPSQEVETAADADGYASITVVEPPLANVTYTVTAKAETAGAMTNIPYSGETGGDDPDKPAIPAPAYPNPNSIPEPTLSIETSGTTVQNPAFRQFTNITPTLWYLVSTSSAVENISITGSPYQSNETVKWTGTYNSAGTVTPILSSTTWSGRSVENWSDAYSGVVEYSSTTDTTQSVTGNWSGTYTYKDVPFPNQDYTSSVNYCAWAPSSYQVMSQTEKDVVNGGAGTVTGNTILSSQYTDSKFTSDVASNMTPPSGSWRDNAALGVLDPIAHRTLASDSSSFSVQNATYEFKCATTGTGPYVFEWYEVFQPDDAGQALQVTHQEWDTAGSQAASGQFTISGTSQATNGTWYIARLDTSTFSPYPDCQWRHEVGVCEPVQCKLVGLPANISGSATWTITPSTSGSFNSPTNIGPSKVFIAGRTPGNVTITVTLPNANTTFTTTLSILAPTGVTYNKIASISMPWWGVGAGMWGQYVFHPTNVSFSGCVYQEVKCPSTALTGANQVMGLTIWHNPDGTSTYLEPPDTNSVWIPIQYDNTAADLDRAEIGPWNTISAEYFNELDSDPTGLTWQIPIRYRGRNDTDNGVLLPGTVSQQMQVDFLLPSFVTKDGTSEYEQ